MQGKAMQNERLLRLLEFLDNDPNDPFIAYAIATEYNTMGDVEKALEQYQLLYNNHPDYIGTYYHFAKLLVNIGNREKAIEVYQKGIQIAQKLGNKHAWSELKGAYLEIAEDDEDY